MLAITAPAPRLAIESRKITREEWLSNATDALRPLFAAVGVEVPAVRVSVGFPGGRGAKASVIGQCWHGSASSDGVGQVFISPVLGDAARVLDVLAHELVHAVNHAAGDNGHGRAFSKIAKPLGLTGKMTATVAGEALAATLTAIAATLGNYPHAALNGGGAGGGLPKQSTRMLKTECPATGYTARTTRKWLDLYGAPVCPCCALQMLVA